MRSKAKKRKVGQIRQPSSEPTQIPLQSRAASVRAALLVYEVETSMGLEDIVKIEISRTSPTAQIINTVRGAVTVATATPDDLLQLRTALAVYQVLQFRISRPSGLLGHENFNRLSKTIQAMISQSSDQYSSFRLSVAGSHTPVMRRLKEELTAALHLQLDDETGDLLLRVRHNEPFWEVLIRMGNRPLSVRSWRTVNMEGALNGSVAHAMCHMLHHDRRGVFLNIACGSGTILAEEYLRNCAGPLLVGIDLSALTLQMAKDNLRASNAYTVANLLQADGKCLPFANASITSLAADLPFGQLVGSAAENASLYPVIFSEAGRVAKTGARFIVITHALRLMERLIPTMHMWRLLNERQIVLGGLHPKIYLFERADH